MKLISYSYNIMTMLADMLFPARCAFCSRILGPDAAVPACPECVAGLPFTHIDLRAFYRNTLCGKHSDAIICVFEYKDSVRRALLRFKFKAKPALYRAFAYFLAEKIKKMTDSVNADIILCVPLYKERLRQRGYNQAGLISGELGRLFNKPDYSCAIVRQRDTGSQSRLGRDKRKTNVDGAFKVVEPEAVNGKAVILVDDILTTGSTAGECCKVLKEAGAEKVYVAAVAFSDRL